MKKLTVLLLLFVMARNDANSQNRKIDSLWKVYNNTAQADTNRLKAIHAIAWSYMSNNPDTAIILAEQELKLANTIPNKQGKKWAANALYTIGASFHYKSNGIVKMLVYRFYETHLNKIDSLFYPRF
ncbi:MAG: hypothetical protein ACYDCN_07085 [Bacteroidia bacterium]